MIIERLNALKKALIANDIDVYYFNTSDYHMSEYVPDYFKTIAYFSGFTGSLATLLVSREESYIFVDGRYFLQADNQCLPNGIHVIKLGTEGALEPIDFLKKNFADATIGLDGRRTSVKFVRNLQKKGIKFKSLDIYSDLIENRPPLKTDKIYSLSVKYTGLSRKKKLEMIHLCLKDKAHVVNNLESIAYILNLRSNDITYTPVFLAYLVFYNKNTYLFTDQNRFDESLLEELYEDKIIIRPYDSYYDFLKLLENAKIIIDENKVNYNTYQAIVKKNKLYNMRSIIEDMKSIKNSVEQKNIRLAHIYDSIAYTKFLIWLEYVDKAGISEYDVAQKLDNFRREFKANDLSFGSIVAYNENAAIVHYAPQQETAKMLDKKGILLVDSGGQYNEGTTDITRTIALGPVDDEVKKYFTLVLKSMFNLSELKFVSGLCGKQIDAIARHDIWNEGVDYRHGTGHGVGFALAVHEGPPNIRYMSTEEKNEEVPLKPGMCFSDEPGVYFENKFGIRCENLLLCQKFKENEFGKFLQFETVTLVPFDTRLIDKNYLDQKTIDVLNAYHKRVYDTISPYLEDYEKQFLARLTQAI